MDTNPDINGYFPCIMNHCDGKYVKRNGKYGEFYGCSNYPKCTTTRTKRDIEEKYMVEVIGEQGDPDEPYFGM